MVIGPAIKIAQTVFKYRKYIYRTLVAQDRAIDKAYRVGGYGRQTRYGVRHGIVAGTVIGSLITNNAEDSPGNGIPKIQPRKQSTSRQPYKTRSGRTRRSTARCPSVTKPDYYRRRSAYR